MKRRVLILTLALLFPFQWINSADWSGCAYDLERAQRAARSASYAAEEAESDKNEYEYCRDYPDTYDYYNDGCAFARDSYNSAVSSLEGELDTLNSRLRSVQWSCAFSFSLHSSIGAGHTLRDQRLCASLQQLKSSIPIATLFSVCKTQMSESSCRQCFGIKK